MATKPTSTPKTYTKNLYNALKRKGSKADDEVKKMLKKKGKK